MMDLPHLSLSYQKMDDLATIAVLMTYIIPDVFVQHVEDIRKLKWTGIQSIRIIYQFLIVFLDLLEILS